MMNIFWWIISVLIIAGFVWLAIVKSIQAHRERIGGGQETLVGRIGTAKTDIAPEGKLYVYGEYWTAKTSGEPIKAGEKARVVDVSVEGEAHLIVEKNSE